MSQLSFISQQIYSSRYPNSYHCFSRLNFVNPLNGYEICSISGGVVDRISLEYKLSILQRRANFRFLIIDRYTWTQG